MAIRSLKTGQFSRSALVGNPVIMPGSYESIATTTVGSTSVSSISFSSIPQTYTHLQLRCFIKTDGATWIPFSVNNDTNTQRATHYLRGNGASATAGAGLGSTSEGNYAMLMDAAQWGVAIIDVLDYANTNKNKTTRVLWGMDNNGAGSIGMSSVLHTTNATTAITSLKLDITQYGGTAKFVQYSHFALYGVN
jgi:hypothetical protein